MHTSNQYADERCTSFDVPLNKALQNDMQTCSPGVLGQLFFGVITGAASVTK